MEKAGFARELKVSFLLSFRLLMSLKLTFLT